MAKALLIGDDVIESSPERGVEGAVAAGHTSATRARAKRLVRAPIEACGQVLVTFRGVAVDESVVRYVQQRAFELGFERAGTLHMKLLKDCPTEPYLAIVRASVGARYFEHSARADDSALALRAALDALSAADPRAQRAT